MATFEGKNICSTYKSILNIGASDNDVLGSTRCRVRDSLNNESSIEIGLRGSSAGICVIGNSQIDGNLDVDGNVCSSSSGFIQTGSAGAKICGPANVSGNIAGGGTITAPGNVTINTNKFTVAASSGNTVVAGTLTVGGNTAVTGQITATGDVIAFLSSDKRLKDDLNKISNSKEILDNISGYSFTWNEKSDRNGKDLGVIAQDVQEVLPEIVNERDNGYLAVDYVKLIPVLIEEVKRLNKEIEALKK